MQDISRVVRVNADITATPSVQRDFGRVLLLTDDTSLRPPTRSRVYSNLAAVGNDFPTNSNVYLDAQIHFNQSPFPKPLVIGRWAEIGEGSRLIGGTPAELTVLQAITTGVVTLNSVNVTINLASATSFATAATILQTAFQAVATNAALASATVSYESGSFVINLGLDANGDPYELDDYGSGTSALALGFTQASGAVLAEGYAADDDIADALGELTRMGHDFYWVALERGITGTITQPDVRNASIAVGATNKAASLDVVGDDVLVANESASEAAQISALGSDRTLLIWSRVRDGKGISFAARMSSVNFDGINTLINPHGVSLPGTTPDSLRDGDIDELERKNLNYYITVGGRNIHRQGFTTDDGTWIDVRYFTDWLVNRMQFDVFGWLLDNPTRTTLTDAGVGGYTGVIEGACLQGVRNGGIAPGFVSEAVAGEIRQITGNANVGRRLNRGFLIHTTPISELSDSERNSRQTPPTRVWIVTTKRFNRAIIDLSIS